MTIQHCPCGRILPHAHTPECEKPRVLVCPNCRGRGEDGDPPDANGEGGWRGACAKCNGTGMITVNGSGE